MILPHLVFPANNIRDLLMWTNIAAPVLVLVNVSHSHPSQQCAVANVIKLFKPNYVAIDIASVKILWKYGASGVNYAKKVIKLYNIGHWRRLMPTPLWDSTPKVSPYNSCRLLLSLPNFRLLDRHQKYICKYTNLAAGAKR